MAKDSKDKKPQSYQELNRQLDEVVAKLESPEVGIDEAVVLYEQALQLARELENHLEKAESRIVEVKAKFSEDD